MLRVQVTTKLTAYTSPRCKKCMPLFPITLTDLLLHVYREMPILLHDFFKIPLKLNRHCTEGRVSSLLIFCLPPLQIRQVTTMHFHHNLLSSVSFVLLPFNTTPS